jgi:uncharacterized membrane protein
MNLRPMLFTNAAILAGMVGVSLWAWDQIPDGARIAVHFDLSGEPDRYGSKLEALTAMPIVLVAITLLLYALPWLDPRRANVEASAKFWNAIAIGVSVLLAYIHVLLVLTATGTAIKMGSAIVPAINVLFILLGNYLAKTRSNWFAGVRTPWTLSSEHSWEKTHRWTGRLFVLSGLAGLTAWLVTDTNTAMIISLAALFATIIAAFVMSYVFWKNDPNRVAGA